MYSNPTYKTDVMKKRNNAKLEKIMKLEVRRIQFPQHQYMKEVQEFIIRKIEHARACFETNKENSAENIADAMYMLSCCEANCLLKSLSCTLSPEMYNLLYTKYKELNDYKVSLKVNTLINRTKQNSYTKCQNHD